MNTSEFLSQLSATELKLAQALAIFNQPAAPRAISQTIRPFAPELSLEQVTAHLADLSARYPDCVYVERDHYFFGPDDRLPILDTLDLGEPSDYYEAGEPPFTRYVLMLRAADYYAQRRKPSRAWTAIDDLQPQLAEFELRCQAEDYSTAATLLAEISFNHLMRWGYYRLVAEMRKQLVGNLEDPLLAQSNLGELGSVYAHLGQMEQAVQCQTAALSIARASGDKENEAVWLSNLGHRYVSLGKIPEAVTSYEQALTISRDLKDRRAESANLGSLGTCNAHLGHFETALSYFYEALNIARDIGDITVEGFYLSNLGNVYAALGQTTRAIASHDQALEIARQTGNRVSESRRLGSLAEALLMEGNFKEALENIRLGLSIDQEIDHEHGKNYKNTVLATLHLLAGELPEARRAAETACQHDYPQSNHNAHLILGLVALRQGDCPAAQPAFRKATTLADGLLGHNPENHDALATKALAFCGLALCADSDSAAFVSEAARYYRLSRAINRAPGLLAQSLRLFDSLAIADGNHLLDQIRPLVVAPPHDR